MTTPISMPVALLRIVLLWAAGLCAAAQFAKFSVPFEELRAVYPEAGTSLGLAVSLISFLGIILGLFAGLVVARIGYRRVLIWALVLGAILSVLQSFLPPIPILLGLRLFEGLSHLAIVVAAPTLIGQFAPATIRSAAMTLWSTFFAMAFAVTAWVGLPMVDTHGMGALLLLHAGACLIMALAIAVTLPALKQEQSGQTVLSLASIARQHVQIYRSPYLAAPALGWLFYTLCFVSLLTLIPGLLPTESRALVISAMPLAGMLVSMTLGVVLLRYWPAVRVIQLGFALALLMTPLLVLAPNSVWPSIAIMAVLGLVQGASFAAIPQLNSTATSQAQANGAMAQMGNLGNTCGTPLMLVILSAGGTTAMALAVMICFAIALALHEVQARRRAGAPEV